MFKPGDKVQVKKSNCGFTGPGEIVQHLYGKAFLVKVEDYVRSMIVVRFGEMCSDQARTSTEAAKVRRLARV